MSRQAIKRMIDIGANLTDPMFVGIYHSEKKHESDFSNVFSRAKSSGIQKIVITGGSLSDSKEALKIASTDDSLYSTVGCHPTRCEEFDHHEKGPSGYFDGLEEIATGPSKSKIVAIGEVGLDYDRIHFCPKEVQKRYFELQLNLAEHTHLPLFLHNRASSSDFFEILTRNRDKFKGGVVHSFDGTLDDVSKIAELGLHIGINGCSLKKEENLDVASKIPIELLMIETDCPWCGIKQSHASNKHVKTRPETHKLKGYKPNSNIQVRERNEPSNLVQVLEVLAEIRHEDFHELAEQVYHNTMKLFFEK